MSWRLRANWSASFGPHWQSKNGQQHSYGYEVWVGEMSTTPRRRDAALRRSANAFSTRDSRERPSRRSTVMRLCIEQPANIRVTRRRSDLVSSPQPPPRGIEVLTTVVPYQLRFRRCPITALAQPVNATLSFRTSAGEWKANVFRGLFVHEADVFGGMIEQPERPPARLRRAQ